MRKKPLDYYKALYEIASEVGSAVAVEKELAALVERTTKALGAKGCSIMLLTEDQRKLVRMADYGLSDSYLKKGLVELDSVTVEALEGRPVVVEDATTDPRVQYREQAQREGIATMVSLPLVLRGEVAGVLRLYTDVPTEFTVGDLAFLSSVANLSATTISKSQLYRRMEEHYKETLFKKMQELAKVEEARDRLIKSVSIVAHDLKSPLAAIQSYLNLILGGYVGEVSDTIKPMIERSNVRIDGLLNLISDLLDISRIEMGEMADEMRSVSLLEVLEAPLQDAQGLAEEKGITLVTDLPTQLPPVYGSPGRLQQAFGNLLGNAVKFTPGGGRVYLKLSEVDGRILCTIQDTGIGIPDEDVPYIFKDFYRARNVEKGSGTGLGLSIVKRVIEAHGGEISVRSPCPEFGGGSEFAFTLSTSVPLAVKNAAEKEESDGSK